MALASVASIADGGDMDATAKTVVKVSSPADILGVLPYRLGFHPKESIVALCLQGPRRRDALVLRMDLLPPEEDEAVAADVVERVARAGAEGVLLVCYSDAPADEPVRARQALIDAIDDGFTSRHIDVVDALLVRHGRWWSYYCDNNGCCPDVGTPVPETLSAAASHYAAEAVGHGAVVLRDRSELTGSIRPTKRVPIDAADRVEREQAIEDASRVLVDSVERGGLRALRALVVTTFRDLCESWAGGSRELPPDKAAAIIFGLRDKRARDEAMTLDLDVEPEVLLALLVALGWSADDEDAAPICTVLAWAAYAHGDGALANVAIERALDCEPAYELAQLIEGGLDAMVAPSQLRRVTEQVRKDLNAKTARATNARRARLRKKRRNRRR